MSYLEVRSLGLELGGISIFSDVSFQVGSGEVIQLTGANGTGKTSVFNVICGLLRGTNGEVFLYGQPQRSADPYRRSQVGAGMSRSYQGSFMVSSLSVFENGLLGTARGRSGILGSLWGKEDTRHLAREQTRDLLRRFGLAGKELGSPDELSTGQRKKLDLVRTFAADAHLLLLDEPSASLDQSTRGELACCVEEARQRGKAILFIDHDASWLVDRPTRLVEI